MTTMMLSGNRIYINRPRPGFVVGIAVLFIALALSRAARAQEQLLVTNYSTNTITVYPRTVNGDAAPTLVFADSLAGPHHLAVSPLQRELFVTNNLADTISVLDVDTGAFKRTIAGNLTALNRPTGVAVDELAEELFVANDFGNSITVYDLTASGNVAPKRTLQGNLTQLGGPVGLAIDPLRNELVVANYRLPSIGSVTVYPRMASGNVAPIRKIEGAATGLNLPQGVAIDFDRDELILASSAFMSPNPGPGAILVFGRTATGNVAPTRRIEGPNTQLCNPVGIALNAIDDELVVANSDFSGLCQESVATYSRTAVGDQAPLRLLPGSGALSQLSHPTAVVVLTAPGKVVSIGPSSMEGAIKISNGDWVSGGYSLKSTVTGKLTVWASVSISGPCSNGGTDSITIPLAPRTYANPAGQTDWIPTGDANSVLSWQGAALVGVTTNSVCGGVGKLNASGGAEFDATVFVNPPQPGSTVTFRFKYRDPAAKGKSNTNCLDASDPMRNKADVCGASWSGTKTFDP